MSRCLKIFGIKNLSRTGGSSYELFDKINFIPIERNKKNNFKNHFRFRQEQFSHKQNPLAGFYCFPSFLPNHACSKRSQKSKTKVFEDLKF